MITCSKCGLPINPKGNWRIPEDSTAEHIVCPEAASGAKPRSGVRLQRVVSEARERQATTKLVTSGVSEAKAVRGRCRGCGYKIDPSCEYCGECLCEEDGY